MLNEKQFRDRTARELRAIANQVQGMITDRELYRRLETMEREMEHANSELAANRDALLDLLRGAYVDATTMRLRRLLAHEASLSIRRTIVHFADYPDLMHDKINQREIAEDASRLDDTASCLKEQIEPHFVAHERTAGALAPALGELHRALDLVTDILKKYYWVVCEGHLDLEPKISGDPVAMFRSSCTK